MNTGPVTDRAPKARRSTWVGMRSHKLVGMCAPAEQRLYSGADLRCRRGALGLPEQDAAKVLSIPVAMLRMWEADVAPAADLTVVIGRLTRLERLADRITEQLVADVARTGRIVTFRTDETAATAGVAHGVAVLHRICAGRAWEERPEAVLAFHDLDERDEPVEGDRRAELMVRLTMLGLTRADIKEHLGVERRRLTSWIRGDAEIPPGVFDDLDELEEAADRHTEALEDVVATACGVVGVASSVEELATVYPDVAQVSLSTHWAAVGVLLADDTSRRARWISPPSRT